MKKINQIKLKIKQMAMLTVKDSRIVTESPFPRPRRGSLRMINVKAMHETIYNQTA